MHVSFDPSACTISKSDMAAIRDLLEFLHQNGDLLGLFREAKSDMAAIRELSEVLRNGELITLLREGRTQPFTLATFGSVPYTFAHTPTDTGLTISNLTVSYTSGLPASSLFASSTASGATLASFSTTGNARLDTSAAIYRYSDLTVNYTTGLPASSLFASSTTSDATLVSFSPTGNTPLDTSAAIHRYSDLTVDYTTGLPAGSLFASSTASGGALASFLPTGSTPLDTSFTIAGIYNPPADPLFVSSPGGAALMPFSSTGSAPLDTSPALASIYNPTVAHSLTLEQPTTDLSFITTSASGQLSFSSTGNTALDVNRIVTGALDLAHFSSLQAADPISFSTTGTTALNTSPAVFCQKQICNVPELNGTNALNSSQSFDAVVFNPGRTELVSFSSTGNTALDLNSTIAGYSPYGPRTLGLAQAVDGPIFIGSAGTRDVTVFSAPPIGNTPFVATLASMPYTFASGVAASGSVVVTGTDQLSLSKTLSDVTTGGNTITSWTVAYRTDKLQ